MNRSTKTSGVIKVICLIIGSAVMLYPLLWMLCASFKPEELVFQSGLHMSQWSLQNYIKGWNGMPGLSFSVFFKNTLFLVACCIIGNLLSCSMTAYAFARLEFPAKNFLFTVLLVSMMLPFHVVLIPRFIIFSSIGWTDSFLPLIVPKFLATEGFFCYLMVQFMRCIPRDLDQAATVDGCGPIQIYFRIILPLCKSSLALTATFTLIWTWNDFFSQLIYISDPNKLTVALGLRAFIDVTSTSNYGQMFAMSIVTLLPIILFFIFAQKQLVEGISMQGLKG